MVNKNQIEYEELENETNLQYPNGIFDIIISPEKNSSQKIAAARLLSETAVHQKDGKDFIDDSLPLFDTIYNFPSVDEESNKNFVPTLAKCYVALATVRLLAHDWNWDRSSYDKLMSFISLIINKYDDKKIGVSNEEDAESEAPIVAVAFQVLLEIFEAENDSETEQEGKDDTEVLRVFARHLLPSAATADDTEKGEEEVQAEDEYGKQKKGKNTKTSSVRAVVNHLHGILSSLLSSSLCPASVTEAAASLVSRLPAPTASPSSTNSTTASKQTQNNNGKPEKAKGKAELAKDEGDAVKRRREEKDAPAKITRPKVGFAALVERLTNITASLPSPPPPSSFSMTPAAVCPTTTTTDGNDNDNAHSTQAQQQQQQHVIAPTIIIVPADVLQSTTAILKGVEKLLVDAAFEAIDEVCDEDLEFLNKIGHLPNKNKPRPKPRRVEKHDDAGEDEEGEEEDFDEEDEEGDGDDEDEEDDAEEDEEKEDVYSYSVSDEVDDHPVTVLSAVEGAVVKLFFVDSVSQPKKGKKAAIATTENAAVTAAAAKRTNIAFNDASLADEERCGKPHWDRATGILVAISAIRSSLWWEEVSADYAQKVDAAANTQSSSTNPAAAAAAAAAAALTVDDIKLLLMAWNSHRFHINTDFEMLEAAIAFVAKRNKALWESAESQYLSLTWICVSNPFVIK